LLIVFRTLGSNAGSPVRAAIFSIFSRCPFNVAHTAVADGRPGAADQLDDLLEPFMSRRAELKSFVPRTCSRKNS